MSQKLEITTARTVYANSIRIIRGRTGSEHALAGVVHTAEMTVDVYGSIADGYACFTVRYAGRSWRADLRRSKPFTERSLVVYAGKFAREVYETAWGETP